MEKREISGRNYNIDALRLLAAMQVFALHYLEQGLDGQGTTQQATRAVLLLFPGVPVFFFLSGFLVFRSAADRRSDADYALRRALRIFPGLWVCLAVSLALVAWAGYPILGHYRELMLWGLAQGSIAQFYHPRLFTGFGTGVLNGSLWTISVEIQFYLLAPYLLKTCRAAIGKPRRVLLLLGAAMLFNEMHGAISTVAEERLASKLLTVSVIPHLMFFLLGGMYYVSGLYRRALPRVAAAITLFAHVAMSATVWMLGGRWGGNYAHSFLGLTLVGVVAAVAFGPPIELARALRGRDFSYGLYLYHMPIINLVLFLSLNPVAAFVMTLLGTAILTAASWYLVERPSLRFAHRLRDNRARVPSDYHRVSALAPSSIQSPSESRDG